jgi:hypothetical protein
MRTLAYHRWGITVSRPCLSENVAAGSLQLDAAALNPMHRRAAGGKEKRYD